MLNAYDGWEITLGWHKHHLMLKQSFSEWKDDLSQTEPRKYWVHHWGKKRASKRRRRERVEVKANSHSFDLWATPAEFQTSVSSSGNAIKGLINRQPQDYDDLQRNSSSRIQVNANVEHARAPGVCSGNCNSSWVNSFFRRVLDVTLRSWKILTPFWLCLHVYLLRSS